jgi:hypothetical protein
VHNNSGGESVGGQLVHHASLRDAGQLPALRLRGDHGDVQQVVLAAGSGGDAEGLGFRV